jgi:small subunit ribosomal protein S21
MAEYKKKFKPKQTDSKLGLYVDVQEGQFEKAFRKFRNKVEDSGLLIEIRERMEYEKPCVGRKKAKNQARRRWLKKVASTKLPPKLY